MYNYFGVVRTITGTGIWEPEPHLKLDLFIKYEMQTKTNSQMPCSAKTQNVW